jgi:hypothetical protein
MYPLSFDKIILVVFKWRVTRMNNEDLINRIEMLREKMISVGMTKGFTSPETIKLSKSLDKFLNLRMMNKLG